jgi:hypothetical protein
MGGGGAVGDDGAVDGLVAAAVGRVGKRMVTSTPLGAGVGGFSSAVGGVSAAGSGAEELGAGAPGTSGDCWLGGVSGG